ncbi:MAG TPA: hypothetical protein ENH58_06300 [Maribacter sp.]|nr:hypothetical protein [Maribacter sp.]HEA79143.1 hypothetical protein [Maribacter sp.]
MNFRPIVCIWTKPRNSFVFWSTLHLKLTAKDNCYFVFLKFSGSIVPETV